MASGEDGADADVLTLYAGLQICNLCWDAASLHHKKYVLAGPTLGIYCGIIYPKKVPGPPNPWTIIMQ